MTPSPETLLALGPILLFLMAFAETAVPAGLLVPAGVSLALASFLAHEGVLAWPPIIVAAGVGGMAGDSVGYWLGRAGSIQSTRVPGFMGRVLASSRRGAERMLRNPPILAVTLARLASFVRTLMPAAAGMSGMTYPRFLTYDIPGVVLWLALYTGIGVIAGESWRMVSGLLGTGWALIILIALAGSWVLARRRRRQVRRRGPTLEPEP